jgi:hypothetical protein
MKLLATTRVAPATVPASASMAWAGAENIANANSVTSEIVALSHTLLCLGIDFIT